MLEFFTKPESIAVIGASREKEKVGRTIFDNLLEGGYKGKIYPINPNTEEINGYKCHKSVLDIQENIDLAIIVIPAKFAPRSVEECGKAKVKGMIIITAGFKEAGPEGLKLEKEIQNLAQQYNIRILGPNCLGLIDPVNNLNASFSAVFPQKGEIAFMSQSGALLTGILDWAKDEDIGFSKLVSLGNRCDLSELDFFKLWAEDDSIKVIIGYIEGVKDGKEFIKIAREVSRKKPIIFIKGGVTASGAKAVSSHTGTLSGTENTFNACFTQTGIIRAFTIEELFDYAIYFAQQKPLSSNSVAIVTNAGGAGILTADACDKAGMRLAGLNLQTINVLKEKLPPHAGFYNPVDILGDAKSDRYEHALKAVFEDENVHGVIVLLTPQAMTEIKETADVICRISKEHDKPIITSFIGANRVKEGFRILKENKIPHYTFPEKGVKAFWTGFKYYKWQETPPPEFKEFQIDREKVEKVIKEQLSKGKINIPEALAREIISAYGFNTPESKLCRSAEEAVDFAGQIGYPVVLKIASPDILHKTDIGGVRAGITDENQVQDAYEGIIMRAKKFMSDAEIWGIFVQKMVKKGKEVILGSSSDPQFGPVIMFGMGGIYVEILKDVSFRIAPISVKDTDEMIKEIKLYPLLKGVRGEKETDLDIVKEYILRMSQLVCDFPEIVEMDINPLVVYPKGQSAVVIDSRMTLRR